MSRCVTFHTSARTRRWQRAVIVPMLIGMLAAPLRGVPTAETDQQEPKGWVFFDKKIAQKLGLLPDELQRLRDLDGSFQKEYNALGNDPMTHAGYQNLSDKRALEVRKLLTAEQYDVWDREYNPRAIASAPPPGGPESAP